MSAVTVQGYSEARNGRGVIALRRGETILEHYHNGGSADFAHSVHSASKSITGLSIGRMVALGMLTFDTLVCTIITEWASDPVKSKITIRHLLTQTAGIQNIGLIPRSYETCIALPVVRPLGMFDYDNSSHIILGEVQRRIVGHPGRWFANNVAAPGGFEMGQWSHIGGNLQQPNTASGANVTLRNFAQIGEMMRVGGRGVLPESVLAELVTACPEYPSAYTFGSLWRTIDPMLEIIKGPLAERTPIPANGYAMIGRGWNLLYVLPEREMVVARIGEAPEAGQPAFVESEFMDLVLKL